MSSLMDRFKVGAGKAAFEADKLRRLQMAQSAVKPLRNEADRLYYELGRLAYALYIQGALSQSELQPAAEQLTATFARIAEAEAGVERIRAEEFVEPIVQRSTPAGLVCPNSHGALASGSMFCQICGAAGVRPEPVPQAPQTMPCSNCGEPLVLDTESCPACNTVVKRCTCGTMLLPNAMFCAECGKPVNG